MLYKYSPEFKQKVINLRLSGKSWEEIYRDVEPNKQNPNISVSSFIRSAQRWMQEFKFVEDKELIDNNGATTTGLNKSSCIIVPTKKESVQYDQNGNITSDKLIELMEGVEITPEVLLKAHNLSVEDWDVLSYRNNLWNSQVKDNGIVVFYQSRVVCKPKEKTYNIEEAFEHLITSYNLPTKTYCGTALNHKMVEVNIADLHLGRLCWDGDTKNTYNYKIARNVYNKVIERISEHLKHLKYNYDYILFPFGNDFFNSDTINKTTTNGTPQKTDLDWQQLFNVGCEMLIDGIVKLADIAPVKVVYIPANHDKVTSYHAIKVAEAWFRNCKDRVEFDVTPISRKCFLYGYNQIEFVHGDKESSKGGNEKASALASTMPIEFADMWSKAKYHEIHAAHLHSEHAIQEINGVIVRRISSPTRADTWTYENGYIGSIKKVQTFIYDKNSGLEHIINTVI